MIFVRQSTVLLLLLAASCMTDLPNPETSEEREVRSFFEGWRRALVRGDFEAMYAGTTPRFRTLWIWHMRHDPENDIFGAQQNLLSEDQGDAFDIWWVSNMDRRDSEVTRLPPSFYEGTWLEETIRKHFHFAREQLSSEFRNLKIVRPSVVSLRATVLVRTHRPEMYVCLKDAEGWKVDGHRKP